MQPLALPAAESWQSETVVWTSSETPLIVTYSQVSRVLEVQTFAFDYQLESRISGPQRHTFAATVSRKGKLLHNAQRHEKEIGTASSST